MAKSYFKRPGTRHFQLVHRSQRDPLLNDPEAGDRVLKEIGKGALDEAEAFSDEEGDGVAAGEAAKFGIYFDDTDYDYLQHLRPIGQASDAVFVEAPTKAAKKRAAFALPEDSLPTHPLDEISYSELVENAAATPTLALGVDPTIQEVLDALEDEAYVMQDQDEDAGEVDDEAFFDEILNGGELENGEVPEWKAAADRAALADRAPTAWEAEMARYGGGGGAQGSLGRASDIGSDEYVSDDDMTDQNASDVDSAALSEGGDTVGAMPAFGRASRRGAATGSAAGSQFSMSSSAMFRNDGLQTLDERFDEIERLYDEDSDGSWSGSDEPVEPSMERADLEDILDDFLNKYEVYGGQYVKTLVADTGAEDTPMARLDKIRTELSRLDVSDTSALSEKERILAIVARQEHDELRRSAKDRRDDLEQVAEKPKERWDCETVLSTYSNVSNHPRLLRLRASTQQTQKRIVLDKATGFPHVDAPEESESESESDGDYEPVPVLARPKGETAAEKKARKQAIKAEKAQRREQKKAVKTAFSNETKRQKNIAYKAVAFGAAADVRVGQTGVKKLA